MSEVLYRKWRPKKLSDVVGQDHITRTLRQAIMSKRIAHAYLFCGPRGTGKTSTARILAKSVNCEQNLDGEPCDQCNSCRSMSEARDLDLIEIDAASHRGIDDVRNIRDKVNFQPNASQYKVYIVDEVHMMTAPAFNALLKTLEEPPPHAIFILATTEFHQLPTTIVSRCQRFEFQRISNEDIEACISNICDQEGIQYDHQAINLIASNSYGSLRDAENLLEQVSLSYHGTVSLENVQQLLGIGKDELALDFVKCAINKNIANGLYLISDIAQKGLDIRRFQQQVIEYLRYTLLVKSGVNKSLNLDTRTLSYIESLANESDIETILNATKIFEDASPKLLSNHTLHMELALIECSLTGELTETGVNELTTVKTDSHETDNNVHTASNVASPSAEDNNISQHNNGADSTVTGNTDVVPENKEEDKHFENEPNAENTPRSHVYEESVTTEPQPDALVIEEQTDSDHISNDIESTTIVNSQYLDTSADLLPDIQRKLKRYKGLKFNIGSLLLDCESISTEGDTLVLNHKNKMNRDRLESELEDPDVREHVQKVVYDLTGTNYSLKLLLTDKHSNSSPTTSGHLVRLARAMGAQILEEEDKTNE